MCDASKCSKAALNARGEDALKMACMGGGIGEESVDSESRDFNDVWRRIDAFIRESWGMADDVESLR